MYNGDITPTRPVRKPIPQGLRFAILREDNYTCQYCGACGCDVKLAIDHVIPVAKGGHTVKANLVTACEECNIGKRAAHLSLPQLMAIPNPRIRSAVLHYEALQRCSDDSEKAWVEQHLPYFIETIGAEYVLGAIVCCDGFSALEQALGHLNNAFYGWRRVEGAEGYV